MHTETRTTDAKGQLLLPITFANATVIIDQLSDNEIRVRRTTTLNEDETPFTEEITAPLSDRDRDHFLDLLTNPPPPNIALKNAATRHKAHRG